MPYAGRNNGHIYVGRFTGRKSVVTGYRCEMTAPLAPLTKENIGPARAKELLKMVSWEKGTFQLEGEYRILFYVDISHYAEWADDIFNRGVITA